jgi:hypothetical protein
MVAGSAGMAFNAVSTVGNSQIYINPQCPMAGLARTLDAPVAIANRSEFANAVNRIQQRGPTSHGPDRAPAPVRPVLPHWIPATPSTVVRTIFFTMRLLWRSVSIHSSSEWKRSALPVRGIVSAGMPRLIGMLESVEAHS